MFARQALAVGLRSASSAGRRSNYVRTLGSQAQRLGRTNTGGSNYNNTSFGRGLAVAAAAATMATAVASVTKMEEAPTTTTAKPSTPATTNNNNDNKFYSIAADNNPPPRPELPTIPLEDVSEHNDEESMWFTFRGAVYDMTGFLQGHPGGAPRLLMAAGQDLEPFWDIYRQHFRGHVIQWMEKYRIGNLSKEDAVKARDFVHGDMFESDPKRQPQDLLPATSKPFNGEPRIETLTDSYLTPNNKFYVRNHLAVPDICPEEYRLIVKGKGKDTIKKKIYKLQDLKTKFPKHEVVTTLQCAGNRREDLHDKDHKIFISPHWVVGAMSTAKWGGVRLRDVLADCGLDVDAIALGEKMPPNGIEHIQMEGYDHDETGYTYGGSFPIEKAVDGLGEVLLAYEMNGEDLPRDHGYPVRVVIPGHVGARQVKWVHKIILSNQESKKSYQCKSYRHFAPDITFEKDLAEWPPARLDQGPIIHEQPVTSFVCNPPQGSTIGVKGVGGGIKKEVTIKGVAWSGGGRKVERVDVSIDGGTSWTAAELYKPISQRYNHHWAWTQFYLTIPLSEEIQEKLKRGEKVKLDVTSKAVDSAFNVQPETMAPYWNPRGIAINHWYHSMVELDPTLEAGQVQRSESEFGFSNTPSGGHFDRQWGLGGWMVDPKHDNDPRKERKDAMA
mmetsp:Transcript_34963/g.51959  ORF Transcript_34963/g.51959 Transcript_34963/m.51959 type:complete len:670 (-) Transcript_34963:83-2092(-)